jgi:hypothetical protein
MIDIFEEITTDPGLFDTWKGPLPAAWVLLLAQLIRSRFGSICPAAARVVDIE